MFAVLAALSLELLELLAGSVVLVQGVAKVLRRHDALRGFVENAPTTGVRVLADESSIRTVASNVGENLHDNGGFQRLAGSSLVLHVVILHKLAKALVATMVVGLLASSHHNLVDAGLEIFRQKFNFDGGVLPRYKERGGNT